MKWVAASLLTCSLFAERTSNLIIDRYLSPYVGAEDIITMHRGLEYSEDWMIKPRENPKRDFWRDSGRFLELFFIWDPINMVANVTQHEVFGHGFRTRALNQKGTYVRRYEIDAPFPYEPIPIMQKKSNVA